MKNENEQLTIVLFAKTTEKHALISPEFDCYYQDSFSLGREAPIEDTFAWLHE